MPIEIPELGDDRHEMWLDLLRLAQKRIEWTLIGAHMVALFAWEAGLPARPSNDADVLVNARVVSDATQKVSRFLVERGYDLSGVTQFNVGHHFVRDGSEIDVLAPEGLGSRANIATIPPARTVQVKGGSQALARTERVLIETRGETGEIPRPNLLGAILVKIRAIEIDDVPRAQQADVALLLSLVDDPDALASDLQRTEQNWLRRHAYFGDPNNPVWDQLEPANRELGVTVYRRLSDT
jgi:hypothetical protein